MTQNNSQDDKDCRAKYYANYVSAFKAEYGGIGDYAFSDRKLIPMLKHSVWPEFLYLFGAGDIIRPRRLNELTFEPSWVASFGLAAAIFIAAPWIMPLWTHHAVQIDPFC